MAFLLEPAPPFRLDLTVWALRRRQNNVIDRWDGRTYSRTLILSGKPVEVTVVQTGTADNPTLKVEATGARIAGHTKLELKPGLERMLGLNTDLSHFYAFALKDARLAPLIDRFRGVKPPRFPAVFEGLANGIACQQLSLTVGITLLSRLAERFGAKAGDTHAFPRPCDLAGQDPRRIRSLGFSEHKVRALLEAAEEIVSGRLDLEALASLDDDSVQRRLLSLRGVGRWTAEYVLLRGLGRTHVFPGDDVGARKGLAKWLELSSTPSDYAGTRAILDAWRPYAGLIYFHLLLQGLAGKGDVT